MRRAILAGLGLALLLPGSAGAATGFQAGADLLSSSLARLEQADDTTTNVALTRDARFALITTRATNLFADDDPDPPGRTRAGGVFRRDLASGALELVAAGDELDEATRELVIRGARGASISDDGRLVAFTTNAPLVAADRNGNADVYVRDLDVPRGAPGAYELISARDGGDVPATYGVRDPDLPGRNPGTETYPGGAISADGRFVVLRTGSVTSDLPDRATTDTPAGTLLVRDRAERRTILVTRESETGEPVGGATGPATISADGSTVAWVGIRAAQQTRFQPGENRNPLTEHYLWRRIADGAAARTRRITGAVDTDDPACDPETSVEPSPTATGPCYGPLADQEAGRVGIGARAPQLSADGRTVVFLAAGALRPDSTGFEGVEVFTTSMAPGATRKDATTQLTRGALSGDPAAAATIDDLAWSADGRWLALLTNRTRFTFPALTPIGTFRRTPDTRELLLADLQRRTVERVVTDRGGGDIDADIGRQPAIAADGATLAFVSSTPDLFFGDANEQADAWLVRRAPPVVAEPPPPEENQGQIVVTQTAEPDEPDLGLGVRDRRDGTVRVSVRAPEPGAFTVFARAGKPLRTVARATRTVRKAGRTAFLLKLTAAERRRLARSRRLSATVRVRFVPTAPGARALTEVGSVRYTLRRAASKTSRTPAKTKTRARGASNWRTSGERDGADL